MQEQGYQNQKEWLEDSLRLLWLLMEKKDQPEAARQAYAAICAREEAGGAVLAVPALCRRLALTGEQAFAVRAALCCELDGALRALYFSQHGCPPDLNWALAMFSRLRGADFYAARQFAADVPAYALLFAPAEQSGWWLDAPLRLRRTAAAILLTGKMPDRQDCQLYPPIGTKGCVPIQQKECTAIGALLDNTLFTIVGARGTGRATLLQRACAARGKALLLCTPELLPEEDEAERRCYLALSALLGGALPALRKTEGSAPVIERLLAQMRRLAIPVAILAERQAAEPDAEWDAPCITLPVRLCPEDAARAWQYFFPHWDGRTAAAFGAQYPCSIGRLCSLAQAARRRTEQAAPDDVRLGLTGRAVTGCRVLPVTGGHISDWIGDDGMREKLGFLAYRATHWRAVSADWEIKPEENLVVLFHGESGTGKTYAASLLAAEAGLPLLIADLSRIADKYIGETEKHLDDIFRVAEEENCLLFFDEADALFAKRTEIGGSNDRYANQSTAYLLQRIETFQGVIVLATNLIKNFDGAFARRLQAIVRFPMPDAAARAALWARYLPAQRLDAGLSVDRLAGLAEVTPACIRAASATAILLAARQGKQTVGFAQAAQALALELEKTGGALPPSLYEER